MRRNHVVELLSKTLRSVAPDCTSILYGSEARGDASEDSDIDVLIVLPDNPQNYASRKIEITESLYEIELSTGVRVSPLVVMKSFWERMKTPFTCNVAKDGIFI